MGVLPSLNVIVKVQHVDGEAYGHAGGYEEKDSLLVVCSVGRDCCSHDQPDVFSANHGTTAQDQSLSMLSLLPVIFELYSGLWTMTCPYMQFAAAAKPKLLWFAYQGWEGLRLTTYLWMFILL